MSIYVQVYNKAKSIYSNYPVALPVKQRSPPEEGKKKKKKKIAVNATPKLQIQHWQHSTPAVVHTAKCDENLPQPYHI